MEEIWQDIEGFEGYYQASSFGNIKNDNRMENLEWCTNGENILHNGSESPLISFAVGGMKATQHKDSKFFK